MEEDLAIVHAAWYNKKSFWLRQSELCENLSLIKEG